MFRNLPEAVATFCHVCFIYHVKTYWAEKKDIQGIKERIYVDGLAQDCSNSSALAMELLQSCTKPLMWHIKQLDKCSICSRHKTSSKLNQLYYPKCVMLNTQLPVNISMNKIDIEWATYIFLYAYRLHTMKLNVLCNQLSNISFRIQIYTACDMPCHHMFTVCSCLLFSEDFSLYQQLSSLYHIKKSSVSVIKQCHNTLLFSVLWRLSSSLLWHYISYKQKISIPPSCIQLLQSNGVIIQMNLITRIDKSEFRNHYGLLTVVSSNTDIYIKIIVWSKINERHHYQQVLQTSHEKTRCRWHANVWSHPNHYPVHQPPHHGYLSVTVIVMN